MRRPNTKQMPARIKNPIKRIQAIWDAIHCTPANPSTPAINATIKKLKDHLNISSSFRHIAYTIGQKSFLFFFLTDVTERQSLSNLITAPNVITSVLRNLIRL